MGAYHNALREEGSKEDLLTALEKEWVRVGELEKQVESMQRDSAVLRALEGAGVDNWEGYEDALEAVED